MASLSESTAKIRKRRSSTEQVKAAEAQQGVCLHHSFVLPFSARDMSSHFRVDIPLSFFRPARCYLATERLWSNCHVAISSCEERKLGLSTRSLHHAQW